ncbi:MAG: GH1 family beta-glucosidase [Sphaerochaetaceae bacterium]
MTYSMPDDFMWGCATASYQVEGFPDRDGKEQSIWDTFCKKPGAILTGENGDVACEQYVRYPEDIRLMASLGFKAYRLSFSWPRIISYGKENQAGIAHYRAVLDCIHKNHMQAYVTLYHWDLPQSLEDAGGWLNRDTAFAFQRYAEVCFREFGDLVDGWITLNEPWCSAYLGYESGAHAPGRKEHGYAIAAHTLLLAHGLAVQSYRRSKLTQPIGIALNPAVTKPATGSEQDGIAAWMEVVTQTDIFLDPLIKGKYPDVLSEQFGMRFPVRDGDMELISQKLDFLGINYYSEHTISYDEKAPYLFCVVPSWQKCTDIGWPVTPYGLLHVLRYFSKKAPGTELFITENGASYATGTSVDGRVHDAQRCEYLCRHIEMCHQAISEGIPLKGYFVWSFMDNFEWTYGYSQRFGVVYVNYQTQERIPKDSAFLLRDFMHNSIEY